MQGICYAGRMLFHVFCQLSSTGFADVGGGLAVRWLP